MKDLRSIILIIAAILLFLPWGSKDIPSEDIVELSRKIKNVMGGPIAKDDALALAGICDAAANCYVLDAKRSEPKYNHPASITSSFKRIGETGMSLHINKDHLSEMSYPIGWVMDERYPGLSDLLGGYMDARKQESQVSRNNIATNLRVLRDALKYAYK